MPAGKGQAVGALSQFGVANGQMDAQAFLNSMNFLSTGLAPSLMQELWQPMESFAAEIRARGGMAPPAESAAAAASAAPQTAEAGQPVAAAREEAAVAEHRAEADAPMAAAALAGRR
eukprot:8263020-Pyramimonas_sp.AAC.1